MLSAHASIKPLGWRVFVEMPLKEAYAPLYPLALRNVLWLVLAFAGAVGDALINALRVTTPDEVAVLLDDLKELGLYELRGRSALVCIWIWDGLRPI